MLGSGILVPSAEDKKALVGNINLDGVFSARSKVLAIPVCACACECVCACLSCGSCSGVCSCACACSCEGED